MKVYQSIHSIKRCTIECEELYRLSYRLRNIKLSLSMMVIDIENKIADLRSNPAQDWLSFT